MNTLQQRYLLSFKKFELKNKKVLISEKTLFSEKEWEARYDQIGLEVVKIKSRKGLGNAILFGGLLLASSYLTMQAFTHGSGIKLPFLLLFFCLTWLAGLWWSLQKYFSAHYILEGGPKILRFFMHSPSEADVMKFIEEIRTRVKCNLKQDLSAFDPDLSFEVQHDHLRYLMKLEAIEFSEYERLRDELRSKHLVK